MTQEHLCPPPFTNSGRHNHRRSKSFSRTTAACARSLPQFSVAEPDRARARETARVKRNVARRSETKRDEARQKYFRDTECLDENSRLLCNTGHGHEASVPLRAEYATSANIYQHYLVEFQGASELKNQHAYRRATPRIQCFGALGDALGYRGPDGSGGNRNDYGRDTMAC
jgi:hypothetical protein